MNTENFVSTGATIGCGFFIGFLIGYALKKLVKLVAVAVGLFFAGIAYLQYEEVVNVNWTKLQAASQNTVSTIANATTQIPGFGSDHHTASSSNDKPWYPVNWKSVNGHCYRIHERISKCH